IMMMRRSLRWLTVSPGPAWAVVVIVSIGFVIAAIMVLDVRIRDYDEGVYWQSLRAMARGEPLFSSVFASQPPGFYYVLLPLYLIGHSLASLRLTVLVLAFLGLAATYLVGRLIAGPFASVIALLLAATSPLYVHQAALVQADGPSVAASMIAVALSLLAVRWGGRASVAAAALTGLAFAFAVGMKLLGAVTVIPIVVVFLGAPRARARLLAAAGAGCVLTALLVLIPAIASPGAAFNDLVLSHVQAGQASKQNLGDNLRLLFLHREGPLEALALIGVVAAVLRQDRSIVMPVAWASASILAVLFYHPLFAHHVVMLSLALALTAAVGLSSLRAGPHPDPPPRAGEENGRAGGNFARGGNLAAAGLVLAAAAAGVVVIVGDIRLARIPDIHDAEMTAAVRATGNPGDFWISDNPYAVAAADRNIPGPLVDTSGQRIKAGLLTVHDLETTRERYRVRWLLEDSFRLFSVPGYQSWLGQHFHAVRYLGGRAVLYEAN